MNNVQLIGHLTRDPELRYTPSAVAVCDVGLAVNERFKNAAGETKEKVLFVDVTVWGKPAESLAKYMAKGSPVAVTGSLQLDQWENEKKEKRSKITVRADRVEFLHRAAGKPDPQAADAPAQHEEDDFPF
jgi:single-strand DNA-binding protein